MKRFKLFDGTAAPGESVQSVLNWDYCILCQCVTNEALQCPKYTERDDVRAGYRSLATSLTKFNDIGALPTSVRLSEFDEGAGIEAAFNAHNAKWHKSCRNLYNTTKLNRALKRGALVSEGTSVADNSNECFPGADYFTRSSLSTASVNSCFFCSKSEDKGCGKLHQVTTLELDARVRHCAHILNDCTLIANLSAGDMIALEAKYHAVCLVSLYKKVHCIWKKWTVCRWCRWIC